MTVYTLDLLRESVEECCDRFDKQRTAILQLIGKPNFARHWVQGLASDTQQKSTDLREWCKEFKVTSKDLLDKHYQDILGKTLVNCDLIKELIGSIASSVKRCLEESLNDSESVELLTAIGGDLEASERMIQVILKLGKPKSEEIRQQIVRDRAETEDMKDFLKDCIQTLSPTRRAESFSVLRKGCLEFDKLEWFWSKILLPREINQDPDQDNQPDSCMINSAHIEKARVALHLFCEAWLEVEPDPVDRPSLDIMRHMPAIACVLHACDQRRLFNDFVACEISDSAIEGDDRSTEDLRAQEDYFNGRVRHALVNEDPDVVAQVLAQFSRVRPRLWKDGDELVLHRTEPLPLVYKNKLASRPGMTVWEVQDAWNPAESYALKVVDAATAAPSQREQLANEIETLRAIGQEDHGHHIVKCIKSYARGSGREELGMLRTPVADGSLNDILRLCCQSFYHRPRLKTTLIQACGCLSYSLAFLHNVKMMRHRDIKPHNILYTQTDKKFDFLWADFGLAHVFRERFFSGQPNPSFGATPEYEAPEIDYLRAGMHTRASDIFALGCVYLEIINVLTLSADYHKNAIDLRTRFCVNNKYYKHNLPKLNEWIESMDTQLALKHDSLLLKLLRLAKRMISHNAEDRPKIGEIALEFRHFSDKWTGLSGKYFFCATCREKITIDRSAQPKHAGIFEHVDSAIDRLNSQSTRASSFQI